MGELSGAGSVKARIDLRRLKVRAVLGSGALAAAVLVSAAASANPPVTPTPVAASQQVQFQVFLPLRNTAALSSLVAAQADPKSPSYHKWLTPADLTAQFAPTAATFAAAEKIVTSAGLKVTSEGLRNFTVTGTAGQVQALMQAKIGTVPTANGGARFVSTNQVVLPASLSALGAKVIAFDFVPEHHTHAKVINAKVNPDPKNRTSAYGGYYYNDLKQAYDYPSYTSLNGSGVGVAIVMANSAKTSDVRAMFAANNWSTTTGYAPFPTFTQYYTEDCYTKPTGAPAAGLYTAAPSGYSTVSGCGFDPNGGSPEASLDTQMVVGGAPGASTALITIPDLSNAAILDAFDDIIRSNKFSIVSNSFGGCELFYSRAYNNGYDYSSDLTLYSEAFQLGNAEGITWVVSSGDEAGLECPSLSYMSDQNGVLHLNGAFVTSVSEPADDPNVTAVGGGNLQTSYASGSITSTYVGENGVANPEIPYDPYRFGAYVTGGYWGAGGGISTLCGSTVCGTGASGYTGQPAYQKLVNTGSTTNRTLPDIGMLVGGCPGGLLSGTCPAYTSDYVVVYIGGTAASLIGTSVAAPEFAGALAVYEQAAGRQGNINPFLYSKLQQQIAAGGANAPANLQFFHMNIGGYDGHYNVTSNQGYNYIYGAGSPDVRKLFGLTSLPAAGNPQTPSNP